MVDEEDVGLLLKGLGGEDEAPLPASLAGLDGKEVAAVEGLGGELAEETPVERRGDAGAGEEDCVDPREVVEILDQRR